jgi:hypothetical protein
VNPSRRTRYQGYTAHARLTNRVRCGFQGSVDGTRMAGVSTQYVVCQYPELVNNKQVKGISYLISPRPEMPHTPITGNHCLRSHWCHSLRSCRSCPRQSLANKIFQREGMQLQCHKVDNEEQEGIRSNRHFRDAREGKGFKGGRT